MSTWSSWRSAATAVSGRVVLVGVLLGGFGSHESAAGGSAAGREPTAPTTTIQVHATNNLGGGVIRETVLFPGWDPYEPVPAFVYRKPDALKLPVVVFIHGMGADKTWQADWHREIAGRGFAVIAIDAHLSGDRA